MNINDVYIGQKVGRKSGDKIYIGYVVKIEGDEISFETKDEIITSKCTKLLGLVKN